jgi:threonine synthase
MDTSLLYYSTNLNAEPVRFKDALLRGQAPDRGLYMPERLPSVFPEELQQLSGKAYYEVAFTVARKFLNKELPEEDLLKIVKDAYDFQLPLEHVYDRKYVMRLDQGPTASFKDFAARMMGRLMQYFSKQEHHNLLILTATSGDTGSAVANAFYGLENIDVVVLYPETEVSDRQRKQMTTLGQNIQAIALDGKFDDCQALVKQAFADPELRHLPLSSANSINIGRLLPQIIYYVYAYTQLCKAPDDKIIFSVPSGNFGNLMGGLIGHAMGLPVKKFVVAVNENDEVPNFVETGKYKKIVPSRNCISNAMNVGHPSNLARLVALYGGQIDEQGNMSKMPEFDRIRHDMYAISISDNETKTVLKQAYRQHKLLLEPHGAVAWSGLSHYLAEHPEDDTPEQVCVSFETAHPAKFPDEIRDLLGIDPEMPPSLQGLDDKQESFITMSHDYSAFKQFLQRNY